MKHLKLTTDIKTQKTMNVPSNLAKSCLLASAIFWTIIGSHDWESSMLLIAFLSLIPIFLVVTVVIIGSICTIFWVFEKKDFNKQQIFRTYFPYYTIIMFGICTFGIIVSNFDIYIIAFFTSAFITTSQSWVWFAKEKELKTTITS